MRILAINQKINNSKQQLLQQNQGISLINQAPKYDSTSFGMAKMPAGVLDHTARLAELEAFYASFRELISEGDEVPATFFQELRRKSPDFQKAFVLKHDDELDTPFSQALWHYVPDTATRILNIVKGLDPQTKSTFALWRNSGGHSHMKVARMNNKPEIAESFFSFVEGLDTDTKRSFALMQNGSGDTHFSDAMLSDEPENASSFLDFVEGLGEQTLADFLKLTDNSVPKLTQFQVAAISDHPEITNRILEMTLKVAPKELLSYDIPFEMQEAHAFHSFAQRVAGDERLAKDETLKFLRQNNWEGALSRLIRTVEAHAQD